MSAPSCAADCGTPLDATLIHEGWTMHPSCEFPALAVTERDVLDGLRAIGRRERRKADERASKRGRRRRP